MNMERAKLSCKNCKWYVEEEEYVYELKEKVSKCCALALQIGTFEDSNRYFGILK